MGRPPRVDRHGGEVYVYRRAGQSCLICGDAVRTGILAGRNSYWCATCQRGRDDTGVR
jgi:endonuclease-8